MSKTRIFSSWGIEHIVIKGNNKIPIFSSDEDCNFFLNLLKNKQESSTILISYVLMKNHVHLILKENDPQKISKLIMKVCGYYAKWYNEKYQRINALFRAKFHNENIMEENYLLNAIRYVHNNPVKANIVSNPMEYRWSSYKEYFYKEKYIDKSIALDYFSLDDLRFNPNQIFINDESEKYFKSSEYVLECVKKYFNINGKVEMFSADENKKKEIIRYLKQEKNISTLLIAKVFNISPRHVQRIANEKNNTNSDTLQML